MPLYIVEKLMNGVTVLDLRGRVTLGPETETLRVTLAHLVKAGHTQILLNLAEVSYIDSVGLSTLVASYTSARKSGGDVKIVSLTKRIRDVMQITRLSTVFDICDSVESALQSFEPKPAA